MKVIWTPLAIERLQEIDEFISKDSLVTAAKFIDIIFQRGELLTEFPYSGRIVPEYKREDFREVIEGNYRIIYRIKEGTIEIVTIFESRRLLPGANE